MVKGLQRKLPNHIISPVTGDYKKVLKAGIIYGANASGKSNFVKALKFISNLIVEGTHSGDLINRKPFALDEKVSIMPSEFSFNFYANEKCYSYGISIDSKNIHHEWLYEILKTSEKKLFERELIDNKESNYSFGSWIDSLDKEKRQFINFVAKGTRLNQPFIKESIDRQLDLFSDAYEWFKNSLHIIFPHTQFNIASLLFDEEKTEILERLISFLEDSDTGIVDYKLEDINLENKLPEMLVKDLEKSIEHDKYVAILEKGGKERVFVKRDKKSNLLKGSELVLKHRGVSESGEPIQIDPQDESDGTVRLIDLIPILLNSPDVPNIFIVDEFDRSLHPNLSYNFLKLFFEHTNDNVQLIVTTHEENLLDLELLRRDEIWFIEKDYDGSSHLYSLEEFQPRYDKDIRKGYLQGRFGAIPVLRPPSFCKEE